MTTPNPATVEKATRLMKPLQLIRSWLADHPELALHLQQTGISFYPIDLARRIADELRAARRDALEEAAKVADRSPYHRGGGLEDCGRIVSEHIAKEIRALAGGEEEE